MRLGEPLIRTQRKFPLPPENSLNSGHREIAGQGVTAWEMWREIFTQFRPLAMDIRVAMM